MKKLLMWGCLTIMAAVGFSCASSTKTPTSKIPERRSFPVDAKVNPCNDFFKYACNGAIEGFQLREDRSRHIFAFNDSHERVLEKKKIYLNGLVKTTSGLNGRSKQLKNYFSSCIDTSARTAEEKSHIADSLKKISSIKTKKGFAQYLSQKAADGADSHLSFGNIANLRNADIYDFIVMPSRMTSMPERSYYKNEKLMAEFKEIASDFFKLIGMDKTEERAKWISKFETEYINMYPTPAERRKIWTLDKYSTKSKLKGITSNYHIDSILARVPAKIKIRNPMDKTFRSANNMFRKYSLEQLKSIYLFQSLSDVMDEAYPEFFKKKICI